MGIAPQSPDIDWGALVPRPIGAEVGPLAGVVPATHVSGELIVTAPEHAPGAPGPKRDTGPTVVIFDEAAEARAKPAIALAESPRVVDDLLLADTKPERVGRTPATPPGGLAVAESPTATVVVHDVVTVEISGATTARITATPSATVVVHGGADDASEATTAPQTTPLASKLVGVAAARGGAGARNAPRATRITDAAPAAITDEPSDGIVRQHIVTAETAPVKRRRLPTDPPDDDRPDDATGEITLPRAQTAEPLISEPSILVADLAALHSAVSKLADEHAHALPVGNDAASPSRDAVIVEARRDAVAFSDAEEAFFRAGHDKKVIPPPAPTESFDDLDEGYRPVGFWGRLRGKALPPDKHDKPDKK
jgi:hypothetical protein